MWQLDREFAGPSGGGRVSPVFGRRGGNFMNGSYWKSGSQLRGRRQFPLRILSALCGVAAFAGSLLSACQTWLPAAEFKLRGHTFTLPNGFILEVIAAPPLV